MGRDSMRLRGPAPLRPRESRRPAWTLGRSGVTGTRREVAEQATLLGCQADERPVASDSTPVPRSSSPTSSLSRSVAWRMGACFSLQTVAVLEYPGRGVVGSASPPVLCQRQQTRPSNRNSTPPRVPRPPAGVLAASQRRSDRLRALASREADPEPPSVETTGAPGAPRSG